MIKSSGFESRQKRRENFVLQGQLFVPTLILVHLQPHVTVVARKRSHHSAKDRLQLNTHALYEAKQPCTLCMWLCMRWCTQNEPRRQQFKGASAMQQPNSTVCTLLLWIFKTTPLKATVTQTESHATKAQ